VIEAAALVPRGSRLEVDVCIVGAGAAGIPLALTLCGKGASVLLLEAGRRRKDPAAQALYEGETGSDLHSPLHRFRTRGLGGSTQNWGGRCTPYDEHDFMRRAHVPHSGWPLSLQELRRHYEAANDWVEAGRFSYDARDAIPWVPAMIKGFDSPVVSTHGMERFSCPTDFGKRYRKQLAGSPDVRVLLGAHCTGLRLAADGGQVRSMDVATLDGNAFSVVPRFAVLAGGGLETARLLLCSDDVEPGGVGNHYDVVGRYYMSHIAASVGTLELSGDVAGVRHGYERAPDGVYCRRRLGIVPAEQNRHGLLNAVARLHFPRIPDPAHGSGVLSGLYLARSLISYEYSQRLRGAETPAAATMARHVLNLARDPMDTAAFLGRTLVQRALARRKFPSVILRNRLNRFSLEVHGEQAPTASSRVQLADTRDALGMRKLRVDWRYGALDVESIGRTLDLAAGEFARTGVGRFTYQRETLEEDLMRHGAYGGHHIGTARMGNDPRTSVVNSDCRVHGVSNLYVAGSAAFPTSSQANPTLTVVALALRVAEHLSRRLQPRLAVPLDLGYGTMQERAPQAVL
jgi:choline dehydrogenase-like flavoprotein